MENYKLLNQLKKFKGYGFLSKANINYLVQIGEVESKEVDGDTYYNIESIERYINKLESGEYQDYYSYKRAFKLITGIENCSRRYSKRFKQLLEIYNISVIPNHYSFKSSEKQLVKKKEVNYFLDNYISLSNFYFENNIKYSLNKFLKAVSDDVKIKVNSLSRNPNWHFAKIEDLRRIVHSQDTVRLKEVKTLLQLTNIAIYEVIKEYHIKVQTGIRGTSVILKKDYEKLRDLQSIFLKEHEEKYLNLKETNCLFKMYGFNKARGEVIAKFEKVSVPWILKIPKYKGSLHLYKKEQIIEYLENKQNIRKLTLEKRQVKYQVYENYYDMYLELLDVKNTILPENNMTLVYWNKYCKKRIMNLQNSSIVENTVVNLSNTTVQFFTFLNGKEIFDYSEKEINLGLFLPVKIPFTYKQSLYSFIRYFNKELIKKGIKALNTEKIKFERRQGSNIRSDIYSMDTYIKLVNHISDYKFHLNNSIEDFNKRGSNSDYGDYWLYVLLHLNNAWRAKDVRAFSFNKKYLTSKYNIQSADDFYNLDLTEEEIQRIYYEYSILPYFHSKNGALANFYCSKNLRTSFAYVIIFLEWKNIKILNEVNLIRLANNNRTVPSRVSINKLKNTELNDFKFESRKINRTILTLIDVIVNQEVNKNNFSIGKYLRGHISADTTYKHYIKIPQANLDFLTLNLFSQGSFGFVYKQLISNLYSEQSWIENSSSHVLRLKNVMGDVFDIEHIATMLESLSNRKNEVKKYIGLMSKEEIECLVKNIDYGLNISKKNNIQCLFRKCLLQKQQCDLCPFSILNMYSLIIITKRFYRNLIFYLNELSTDNYPLGEKLKRYKLLLIDFERVLEGVETFGENLIESILDEDLQTIFMAVEKINEPRLIEDELC